MASFSNLIPEQHKMQQQETAVDILSAGAPALPSGPARAPLTDSQMGIYLECMQVPDSRMYNIPIHFVFTPAAPITAAAAKAAVDAVLKLHPALYAHIEEEDGQIYMVRGQFPENGLCLLGGTISGAEELKKIADNLVRPMDLKSAPLCRAVLYTCEGKLHLFLESHHIVSDGTSVKILFGQFLDALDRRMPEAEETDAFSLFAAESRILESPAHEEDMAYFDRLLSGVETDSALLPDFPEAPEGLRHSVRYDTRFDGRAIEEQLKGTGITKNTLFMGAFGYALAKMTGQEESLFTAGESGRKKISTVERTVAMMVRTLPVVMQIDENKTGWELLEELQGQFLQSIRHDSASFAELNRKYGVTSDIAFVYQSKMFEPRKNGSAEGQLRVLETGDAFAKLNCSVLKEDGSFLFRIEYRPDLYKPDTIRRFAELFIKAAAFFLAGRPLKELELVSATDRALLREFNRSDLPCNDGKTFPEIFREIVPAHAGKPAVVFRDSTYTYSELDDLSDRVAAYVHSKGIGRGQTVAVLIPRCEYMAIASIGVLKAGAAYEPMDPAYPAERLTFMHKDADVRLLIADRSMVNLLPEFQGDILFTDEIPVLPAVSKEDIRAMGPCPEDTFVLLYTSGTTGTPKGVMLSHRNLSAFIAGHTRTLDVSEHSRLTLYPSYGFDAHMADLYLAMANGSTLYIIPDELRLDFPALKDYLEANAVTHTLMTTQVARQFLVEYSHVEHLKVLSTGGESLLSYEQKPDYKVLNLYGPTEATVCVTGFCVDCDCNPIPIGHPLPNCRIYVADSYGRPVPVGAPGELIACGPQVGKGYLNRPEKTAEVFVPNTYEESPDENHLRCYKTGDIVRWSDDGNLIFIGRRDLQVKIRGYRIELSEVEQVIRSYPGIKDAAVIAADGQGGKCIHAYIVADSPVDISGLKSFIGSKKPDYMIPAGILQIDSIPLTVNQKLDKRKLPPIAAAARPENHGSARSLTLLEEQLAAILKEIVGEVDIDVQAEFTAAGITSISSIRLASRIYKQFGLHITSKDILNGGSILSVENAVIRQLMEQKLPEDPAPAAPIRAAYPLTQTQLGIYLDSLRTGTGAYNIPLFYRLPADISTEKLKKAIRAAIENHPSMLVYITPNEQGEPVCCPAPDMAYEITEEALPAGGPILTEFTFTRAPLFHAGILSHGEERYLLLELHHIIGDGESMAILMDDIDRAYRGEKLNPEELSAFDLALQEEAARKGEQLAQARQAYDSIFRGVSADYAPCPDQKGAPAHAVFEQAVSSPAGAIHDLCAKYGVTENVFFTAAFALTEARFTFHEDALFATIYNGRTDPRTERLVSMLVKTLPVYVSVEPGTAVGAFLKAVEAQLGILRQHDIFSFADAAREFGVGADVMFIYQGKILSGARLDGSVLEAIPVAFESPKAELSAEVFEGDAGFGLTLEYNAGRYSATWASGFADAYLACVGGLLRAETLGEVDITSEAALRRFDRFNDTDIPVAYRPAYRRLVEQAQAHPDRVALIASPEGKGRFRDSAGKRIYETLTFAQLDNLTNALAQKLLALGVKPGEPVGIMTGRSKEIYIGEFGILKAGSPFVFLSPAYPKDRILYICKEAGVRKIVTTHAVAGFHGALYVEEWLQPVFADEIPPEISAECPNLEVSPDALAYMIYTSGSTGQPKGVMITQKGLNNLADNNEKNLQIKDLLADVMCSVTAFTFDASIVDGYVPLANGSTVCIASEEDIHNPLEFCGFCMDNGVKAFVCTPSFAVSLLDCPGLEQVIRRLHAICCGGEVFPPMLYDRLKALNPDIHLINGYGPSETTVACSARLLQSADAIDIGTPISNTKIYIIDRQRHILPMGALGELAITGTGVGLGYLNRPDLTEKAFFPLNGEPAYRTGDLALITNSGYIEFHGRIDNQVKLRGLRVELGEIESAINACPGVKNSIVLVKGQSSNQYLAAYYTAEGDISDEDIRTEISKKLTEYMVPRVFLRLAEMPMTANGKIDKKALPEVAADNPQGEYVAPATPMEEALCKAFAEALGVERVGVTDDFFRLGGTSLTATKIAMFAMAHQIPLVYKDVFSNPTVRQLSLLAGSATSTEPENESGAGEDYAEINKALSGNVWQTGDDPGRRPLGNVLLTGATGFLGMHVLSSLLERETGQVYCLLKKGSAESVEKRLNSIFFYYFEQAPGELAGGRIHCVEGDITDAQRIADLKDLNIDTVINCAACVKHFANGDVLERVNVQGVENLTKLCLAKQIRLIHVSTISVAGESVNGTPGKDRKLAENELYFGQTLENQYIQSKFRSEQVVLRAVSEGLDGKIMRLGNLMPRFSDGEFQINFLTNGFMRQLRGYHALGCAPYSALSGELEFSPIDDTAAAILALAETGSKYTVFHVNNVHRVFMSDVFRAMNLAGLKVDCVEEAEFAQRLGAAVADAGDEVAGLIAYLNRDSGEERHMLGCDNRFTADVLNRIGCHWNITGLDYLVNAFRNLDGFGFFSKA